MDELIDKSVFRSDKETLASIKNLLAGMPVKRAYLFGSRARGDATPESNWDILVDLKEEATLFDLAQMHITMENSVAHKVDIVSSGGVRLRIWPYINADKILIYKEKNS